MDKGDLPTEAGGTPDSVSLIGRAGADWDVLALGEALQNELDVPEAPLYSETATAR